MNPKSQTLFGFKLELLRINPGGKRIRDVGWLVVFFFLWEKWWTLISSCFLILLILFLLYVSFAAYPPSLSSSPYPSISLSPLSMGCLFSSLFPPISPSSPPLCLHSCYSALSFICGEFLLPGTRALWLDESPSILKHPLQWKKVKKMLLGWKWMAKNGSMISRPCLWGLVTPHWLNTAVADGVWVSWGPSVLSSHQRTSAVLSISCPQLLWQWFFDKKEEIQGESRSGLCIVSRVFRIRGQMALMREEILVAAEYGVPPNLSLGLLSLGMGIPCVNSGIHQELGCGVWWTELGHSCTVGSWEYYLNFPSFGLLTIYLSTYLPTYLSI